MSDNEGEIGPGRYRGLPWVAGPGRLSLSGERRASWPRAERSNDLGAERG